MEVHSNNSPGYKKSKKQKTLEKQTSKANKLAKKGKLKGYIQASAKKDDGSKARNYNKMINRQLSEASKGGKNSKNVISGLKALMVKEAIIQPTGTTGHSYINKKK